MTKRKDIFDLFRENEHKLTSPPSTHSWRRLERRLDNHRHRQQHSIFRPLAMVAAIALLAVFTFLITIGFGEQRNRLFAFNNRAQPSLEQLTYTDAAAEEGDIQLIMVAQHAQQERRSTISEGTAQQKLVPKGQSNTTSLSHLQQFDWLKGKWQSLSSDGKTAILEEWSQLGQRQISGLATKNGQVIEQMQLKASSKGLIFISDFGTGTPLQYQLKTLNQQEAIFENKGVDFPEQIIFKKESPSRLKVIYQNAHIETDETARLNALQERHQMASQQAVRYMSRLAFQ